MNSTDPRNIGYIPVLPAAGTKFQHWQALEDSPDRQQVDTYH